MPNKENRFYKGSLTTIWVLTAIGLFSAFAFAQDAEDEDYISPVRPTTSDSATIRKKGILQIETGGDFDFRAADFRSEQSNSLGMR